MGFLFLLAVLFIGGLAAAGYISYLVWRSGTFGRVVLGVMVTGLCWLAYDAIYPSESFYRSELQRLVKLSLPADAVFLVKDATFPDHFGDYTACFVVRLTPVAMTSLRSQLGPDRTTTSATTFECKSWSIKVANPAEVLEFDLSSQATREDAMISISLAPKENLAKVSWFLW